MALQGNTLCLFQYVEKHGKELYEAIEDKAKDKKYFSYMEELTPQEEKLLEKLRKNLTTLLSWRHMGLSLLELILGICITLFLLVLVSLG